MNQGFVSVMSDSDIFYPDTPSYGMFRYPLFVFAFVFLCLFAAWGGLMLVRLHRTRKGKRLPACYRRVCLAAECLAVFSLCLFVLQAIYDAVYDNGVLVDDYFLYVSTSDTQGFGAIGVWLVFFLLFCAIFGGGRLLLRRRLRLLDHAFLRVPFDGCMAVSALAALGSASAQENHAVMWAVALGVSAAAFAIVWLLRWKITGIRDSAVYLAAGIAYSSLAPLFLLIPSAIGLYGALWANIVCGVLSAAALSALALLWVRTLFRYAEYRRGLKEISLLVTDKPAAADVPELVGIVADMDTRFLAFARIYDYKEAEIIVRRICAKNSAS